MGDVAPSSTHSGNSEMVSISAKILVGTVAVVFFMMALLFFVHLYAKWYWSRYEDPRVVSWRRREARRGRAAARGDQHRGLDPSALGSIPEVAYNPKEFKEGLECAVCLSEVSEGEKIRLLPKCNHGFHVNCIDMWFHSHSTCPLCRNPVVSTQNPSSDLSDNNNGIDLQEIDVSSSSESDSDDDHSSYASPHSIEAPTFPTNVLFWGNETQVSSLEQPSEEASTSTSNTNGIGMQKGTLVIDIPRQFCEDCLSSPPLGSHCEDEAKSPVVTTLRSLKRLLSRGKRVAPSPRGSSSVEFEQV